MNHHRIALLVVLVLSLVTFSAAHAQTTMEKDEIYNAAVLQLETYLEERHEESGKLQLILAAFEDLKGYNMSRQFSHYVTVLLKVANHEFDWELKIEMESLSGESYQRFRQYLEELFKYSSIGTIQNLIDYTTAREYEYNGETKQAVAQYKKCLEFFDADQRYTELLQNRYTAQYEEAKRQMREGQLAAAYIAFMQITEYEDSKTYADTIVELLGYTPSSPDDMLREVKDLKAAETTATAVTLTWTPAEHASAYEIRQDGQILGTVKSARYTADKLKPDTQYTFSVTAKSGQVEAQAVSLTVKTAELVTPTPQPQLEVGSYVTFGHYEQDADHGNGPEPIEWLVLDYEANNNRALLLSRYGLDVKPYNEEYTDITWGKCTLRTWLNKDFMNKAFGNSEQNAILTTAVDNSKSQGYSGWSTDGGNNTQDKIFLLSYAEANRYFGVTYNDNNNAKSRVAPTAYAIKQRAYTSGTAKTADGQVAGWWWLRSPGRNPYYAAYVNYFGSLSRDYVSGVSTCVRPALWVNLNSEIF